MAKIKVPFREVDIINFCQRWKIRELALFGSSLRDDFSSESDLDVLVTFDPHANWGLLDHVEMRDELQTLLGREVDLISRRALERSKNEIRRSEILRSARVLYSQ